MEISGCCYICLRTDRELKVVDNRLSNFHAELLRLYNLTFKPEYCMECEHMLKKVYNFRMRCQRAFKAYENWMKTKKKTPENRLHTLLPQSTLGIWTSNHIAVYCIIHQGKTVHCKEQTKQNQCSTTNADLDGNVSPNDEIKSEKDFGYIDPLKEIMMDIDLSNNTEVDNLLLDDIKEEANLSDSNNCNYNTDIDMERSKSLTNSTSNDYCNTKNTEENPKAQHKDELANIFSDYNSHSDHVMEQEDDMKQTNKQQTNTSDDHDGTLKNDIERNKQNIASAEKKSTPIKKLASLKLPKFTRFPLKKNRIYSKEGLITRVQERFDSCGDIEIKPGTLLDKQFVIECLRDKMSMRSLKFLWRKIFANNTQSLTRMFGMIQSKYKDDPKYKTVFDIEYLNTEEKILQEFQNRKTYKCYVDAEFKCDLCYSGFKHKKVLDYHNKISHDNAKDFACAVCHVKIRGKRYIHMNANHEAVYKCKLCPLIIYHRATMIKHYDQHMGKVYTCVPCGKKYNSHSAYESHQTKKHRTGNHNCETCGRCFASETALKLHNSTSQTHKKHTQSPERTRCEQCDITFESHMGYTVHMRNKHQVKSVVNRCPVLTCRECNATGPSYGWLTLHYRLEHPDADISVAYADKRMHLCHVCGKGYSNKYTLHHHIYTHTSVRRYICNMCPKRFHTTLGLYNHHVTHRPPMQVCEHCGKRFRSRSNLTNHMKIHIGDRRYKCDTCGKGFLLSSALNEHINGVHLQIRRVKKKKFSDVGLSDAGVSDAGVSDAGVSDTGVSDSRVSRKRKKKASYTEKSSE